MTTTRREKAALRDAELQRRRAERNRSLADRRRRQVEALTKAIRDHHRAVTKKDDWAADERLWELIGIENEVAA